MDRRLINYYNRELRHIREMGSEFARQFPKIAGRLGLEGFECADPYVERLLEGFAFLAARVQLKLDSQFPRFTNALLETVYPHYLAPTPSMAVVQFHPDHQEQTLQSGYRVPRHTVLRSGVGRGDQTASEYRTAHELTLWPLELAEARYHVQTLGTLDLPDVGGAKAAIQLRLRSASGAPLGKVPLEALTLFLRGGEGIASRIYEQLFAHGTAVVAQPTARPAPWREVLGRRSIRRLGFEAGEALLPYDARSFQGYRLLHEYFAFPQRFLFAELRGLKAAMRRCGEQVRELDVIVTLDEADVDLEGALTAEHFALHCTPAINLFPKRADRVHVTERFAEHHVVPDRTRPLDFEVYRVETVTGFGATSADECEFRPFYHAVDDSDGEAYFAVNRVPRVLSSEAKRRGPRSSYVGSEVYISLVDAEAAPYPLDLRQLGVGTLCSNRDLPLRMPVGRGSTDFSPESGLPARSIRCVAGPTAPRPSFVEGSTAWRLISHLSLNYLSLMDAQHGSAAAAVRQVLSLYADLADAATRKQIDGLKQVAARPIVRRTPTEGPISFARGLEIEVTFDEASFEGVGAFLLGAVLEQFFTRYISVNSFTQTVVRSTDREQIMRWPLRLGHRPIF